MDQSKALYQQHRPKRFNEIYGQEAVLMVLKNSILYNKVQNAYIFCGKHGTGKTSTARIFAAAINCPNFKDHQDVCIDDCVACKSIVDGHADVIEIDAASNSGVDYIRDLRQELNLSPLELNRKVYIVDEAHMLSKAAWDAMLKILEDPNINVTFIFATTENTKIPKTIKSRSIELTFRDLTESHIESWISRILEAEGIEFDKKALKVILTVSDGSFRDALTLIDKKILLSNEKKLTEAGVAEVANIPTPTEISKWLKIMVKLNMEETMDILKEFFRKGYHPISLARLAVSIAKEILQNRIRTNEAPLWARMVETFYVFLKDSRAIFNPEISLEILILQFLLKDVHFAQMESTKTIVKENVEDLSKKVPSFKTETVQEEKPKIIEKSVTQEITENEDETTTIKSYDRRETIKEPLETIMGINTNVTEEVGTETIEETLSDSGDIEETSEISADSIDLDLSDTIIDLEANRKEGENIPVLEKFLIEETKVTESYKKDLGDRKVVRDSIETNKITKEEKIGELAWGVIMDSYKRKDILVLPESWNLNLEGILAHFYNSFSPESKEVQEVNSKWGKIEEYVNDEAQLPYSALLMDARFALLSGKVIYLTFDSPMRAALINRMSRTAPFLSFIRKLLGDNYWVIALSSNDWKDTVHEYHLQQQASIDDLKQFKVPHEPNAIDKSFRPAKDARSKILQKLESDPELKDYVIKEQE